MLNGQPTCQVFREPITFELIQALETFSSACVGLVFTFTSIFMYSNSLGPVLPIECCNGVRNGEKESRIPLLVWDRLIAQEGKQEPAYLFSLGRYFGVGSHFLVKVPGRGTKPPLHSLKQHHLYLIECRLVLETSEENDLLVLLCVNGGEAVYGVWACDLPEERGTFKLSRDTFVQPPLPDLIWNPKPASEAMPRWIHLGD